MKKRIDEVMVEQGMVQSRAHAARLIKMGRVRSGGILAKKAGFLVFPNNPVEILGGENYVSRAGFKLASVAKKLNVNFQDQVMLDVGSSTGGFTDYALQHGTIKVIAVDVGTEQLHPTLRGDKRIHLYEKTDIRDVEAKLIQDVTLVVIDVSFISLREILPNLFSKLPKNTVVLAMVKPQFEAGDKFKHNGVIKNDTIRRKILKDFEDWVRTKAVLGDKADSDVAGGKGNRERFYVLRSNK
jgi:23S rRNA (cytidine1920-2'-O)/16S rRNA (cytidine1409-2'-O)-methyltransferase